MKLFLFWMGDGAAQQRSALCGTEPCRAASRPIKTKKYFEIFTLFWCTFDNGKSFTWTSASLGFSPQYLSNGPKLLVLIMPVFSVSKWANASWYKTTKSAGRLSAIPDAGTTLTGQLTLISNMEVEASRLGNTRRLLAPDARYFP